MAAEIEALARRDVSASLLARWEKGLVLPTLPYADAIIRLTRGRVSLAVLVADGPKDKRKERAHG